MALEPLEKFDLFFILFFYLSKNNSADRGKSVASVREEVRGGGAGGASRGAVGRTSKLLVK